MPLHVYGINYRTAPIELREHMAIAHEKLSESLASLLTKPGVSEAMILATCNRCELYTVIQDPKRVKEWLNIQHLLSEDKFSNFIYEYTGSEAMQHLLRVACGLDSLALGESQILGQLRNAFIESKESNALGPVLGHLVENVLANAKKIRSQTGINKHTTSVASTAVSLAKCIFSDFSPLSVLLIGAGETAELAAHHFYEQGVNQIITANRTLSNAEGLAEKFAGQSIPLGEIPRYLPRVDIVITTTASPLPILGKGMVERALKSGRKRPMYIIDIAMPRDVEPEVAELDGIYLYNIDDLQNIAEDGLKERQLAAERAEKIIIAWVKQYQHSLHGKAFIDTIKSFRQRVDELRYQEVDKALRALEAGQDAEDVLMSMSKALTSKIMHYPTIQLRRAQKTGQREILDIAKHLFDIEKL